MNPLYEAQIALTRHCATLVIKLEQALETYCSTNSQHDKERLFADIKNHSKCLSLLAPFYCSDSDKVSTNELQKLCSLLKNENYQTSDEEQVRLLTKIFLSISQLPIPGYL